MRTVHRQSLWIVAPIALLMGLTVLAAPFGSPYIDTARDIHAAWRIATGAEWPVLGPEIGFFTHLGPIWFYLLAIPVALTGTYSGTALFVALVASLKFPLAYFLGSRWLDWRFGLLWAGLLAWPGLWMYSLFTFTHFSVIEAAVLLFALVAWRDWQQPSSSRALLTGIAFGLMLHAHPTTVFFGIILPLLWWRQGTRRTLRALSYSLGCALLFLPLLSLGHVDATAPGETTGITSILDHLGQMATPQSLADGPLLWWNTVILGGTAAIHLLASREHWPLLIGSALVAGLALLLVASIARAATLVVRHSDQSTIGGRHRSLEMSRSRIPLSLILGTGILGSLAYSSFVATLRDDTAWYWMLGMSPLVSALAASLLWALPASRWQPFALVWVLGGAIVFSGLLLYSFWSTAQDGTSRHFPAALMTNLKNPGLKHPAPTFPGVTFIDTDRLGYILCRDPTSTAVLHGAFGFILEGLGETPAALHCQRTEGIFVAGIGPSAKTQHWLGLGPAVHGAMAIDVDHWIGTIALVSNARPVYPETAIPVATAHDYLSRHRQRSIPRPLELEFTALGSESLVLNNVFYWWTISEVDSITVDATPARLDAADAITRIFSCIDCNPATPVTWTLHITVDPNFPPDILFLPTEGLDT